MIATTGYTNEITRNSRSHAYVIAYVIAHPVQYPAWSEFGYVNEDCSTSMLRSISLQLEFWSETSDLTCSWCSSCLGSVNPSPLASLRHACDGVVVGNPIEYGSLFFLTGFWVFLINVGSSPREGVSSSLDLCGNNRERRVWYNCEGSMWMRQNLAVQGRELKITESELSIKLRRSALICKKNEGVYTSSHARQSRTGIHPLSGKVWCGSRV